MQLVGGASVELERVVLGTNRVTSLTGGLYSPMSVVVECAAGSTVGLVTGVAK